MPASSAYRSRFGSLSKAFQLIGYGLDRDRHFLETNRDLRGMLPRILTETIAGIEACGASVAFDALTNILTINGELTVSIVFGRCVRMKAGLRWKVRWGTSLRPDLTIAIRMDELNKGVLDYFLLPRIDLNRKRLILGKNNESLAAYRFKTLDPFFCLIARSGVEVAA
jgi:hypothetical protein